MITVVRTPTPDAQLTEQVRRLLDDAFDGEFGEDDWAHALGGTHVVVMDGDEVVAHASVVDRTLRFGAADATIATTVGYVEAVATGTRRQGEGHGTRAMSAIAEVITSRSQLGVLSTGEHHFYERLGWQRWRGETWVRDTDGRRRRTPDEDDGIMVLSTGNAPVVDLTGFVECDTRAGDDW